MPNFEQLAFFLEKYFPEAISPDQLNRFEKAWEAYLEWNEKINVISRKDIANLAERHFLHSLMIAKIAPFKPETRILDAGTGGGFPGIPLAILFPETHFHLVDSRGKKITVVQNIVQAAQLENVQSSVQRVEQLGGSYDFVVSRAVASLDKFVPWVRKLVHSEHRHDFKNGILYLRGGKVRQEIAEAGIKGLRNKVYPISDHFDEPFFEEKSLVHLWW